MRDKAGHFNPRTPYGVRPSPVVPSAIRARFQSTHPIRGATIKCAQERPNGDISIHAPHTGCDLDDPDAAVQGGISIHAPHPGCDPGYADCPFRPPDFNPRTPSGVRRSATSSSWLRQRFQSTHPIRGATLHGRHVDPHLRISIHAPHTGCDGAILAVKAEAENFNPRTPYGVRHARNIDGIPAWTFQSTHPIRGATMRSSLFAERLKISIHAPHTGCDFTDWSASSEMFVFQSTHPIRGATCRGYEQTIPLE